MVVPLDKLTKYRLLYGESYPSIAIFHVVPFKSLCFMESDSMYVHVHEILVYTPAGSSGDTDP